MGLVEDTLTLMGFLPLERPDFKKKVSEETFMEEGRLYNKIEKLEELNRKYVWVSDFHVGAIAGELIYNPVMVDSYILNNCSKSGKIKVLKIHDLKHIW
jgi:hypothetical protein